MEKNIYQRCPATLFSSGFCAGMKLNLFSTAQMTELPCLSNAPTARQIEPPFCWQQAVRVSAAWLYAVGTWHCEYLKLLRNHLQYFDFIIFFFVTCKKKKSSRFQSEIRFYSFSLFGVGERVHCR